MNTITLELPESLAAAVSTPEGMARVRALIEAEFGGEELDPELVARGRRGAADFAEGRHSALEESRARATQALNQKIEDDKRRGA